MPGKEYECKDCGRAFLVYEDEKRGPKCPSCEGENVAPKAAKPLPEWIVRRNNSDCSGCN